MLIRAVGQMEMSADSKRKRCQKDRILTERARQHQEEALDDALPICTLLHAHTVKVLCRFAGILFLSGISGNELRFGICLYVQLDKWK